MSTLPQDAATDDTVPADELSADLAQAKLLLREGDSKAAVLHVLETMKKGGIDIVTLTEFHAIFTAAGRTDIAANLRTELLRALDQVERDTIDDADRLAQCGYVRTELDDHTGALDPIERAMALDPLNFRLLFLYGLAMIKAGVFDATRLDVEPALKVVKNPVDLISSLASLLGNFGLRDDALAMLDRCEPHVATPGDRGRVDTLRAGLKGDIPEIDQRQMAAGLFDSFARTYDEKLAMLGNNGPEVIARMLELLDLPRDQRLDILDAGCGTGLCAPYLRPYGRHLHGVDLSIPMLEKCRDKGGFDLLTRTDLAVRDTFPQGDFDLVVSGDVLVYFGALDTVFANIFDVLRPGGRFVFTVEEAPETVHQRGFAYTPSGRNHHSEGYVRDVLARVGFAGVDRVHREVLRHEFGNPIAGLAVATRKPG